MPDNMAIRAIVLDRKLLVRECLIDNGIENLKWSETYF